MIFEIAFILVFIATISIIWAILEIIFLEIILSDRPKPKRSKSVRKPFDR